MLLYVRLYAILKTWCFCYTHRMQRWGLNTYLYGPKDDLKHRLLWREVYSTEEEGVEQFHLCQLFIYSWSLSFLTLTLLLSHSVCLCSPAESTGAWSWVERIEVCVRALSWSGHRLLQLLWPHTAQTQTSTGTWIHAYAYAVTCVHINLFAWETWLQDKGSYY